MWSLGERKIEGSWKIRMKLYDALLKSTVMYGAEVGVCERREEIEVIEIEVIK